MNKIIIDTLNTITIDDIPNTAIIVFDLKTSSRGILIPSTYFGYAGKIPVTERTYFARILDSSFMYGNGYTLYKYNDREIGTIKEWVDNFNINDVNDAIFYVLDSLEELVKFYNKTI